MSSVAATTPSKEEDPQKTIDAIKKANAESADAEQNGAASEEISALNGSLIKINIDDYMGDNEEEEVSKFDLDDDSFAEVKSEDYPHNLHLVIKGFDKEFVKNKDKVKEELRKLFTDTIKVDLPSVYSPEGKNNYVYIRAKTQEDKKKILSALSEPTSFLTYMIQAKPCLTNNFAYVIVDDSNKDDALDLILKHRNLSYRDQLIHKSNEARQLLKATLDKFQDEIKARVEKLERKYQPPHANVEKIVPLVPTQNYLRECNVRIETNPNTNEIVSGIVVTDEKLSTVYLLPLKYCSHIANPIIENVELFVSFLKTTTHLKAYNRATGEGDVIGLKLMMNRACEVMMTIELVRKSEVAYGFVPLDPKEAETSAELALFGKKAKLARIANNKRIRMRKNKPNLGAKAAGTAVAKEGETTSAPGETASTESKPAETAEPKPAEDASSKEEEEKKDESGEPAKEEEIKPSEPIHLRSDEEDFADIQVTNLERMSITDQVNSIRSEVVDFFNKHKIRQGIVLVIISWVKILGRSLQLKISFMSTRALRGTEFGNESVLQIQALLCLKLTEIFKRGVLRDDYNGHPYDYNPVKSFVPRIVTFESLMRAVEDVVNFAKHPPENLALCTDYRFLMFYFAKKCKQLMLFHRWKCAEGSFRPQWWVKSGFRTPGMPICFAQNSHGQVKEANKLFTAKGIPGTLITWGDMNLGIFARLVELGCKQVVMVFPKSSVFGSLGKYIKMAYPYLRLTRVITVDCQPDGELFSFVAVFQQASGAPPLKKIPGVTPGLVIGPAAVGMKRPAPSGPPRPLVVDQGGPPKKFQRRDFPMGRPPMDGPPRGGNFGRDRYMDDRPPFGGPPQNDPWVDNRGPSYQSDRFDRGGPGGPPPSSYGPPPQMESRSMGPPPSAGPPAPDPNITSALNTLSVFMQSQLEFNKMLRTNIEKMSTTPGPAAPIPPPLSATSAQSSFPEPVAPPAPPLSRPRRDSPPPPLMATKRSWTKEEPDRDTKRPFYGGSSGGGRNYYDDGPASGPSESFGSRRGGTGSRPTTSDRGGRDPRGSDCWGDTDVTPSKAWDSAPSAPAGGSGGGGRYSGGSPSVWGSRDEPNSSYSRDVRVKDEEPARPPRGGGGGGGGFASEQRSSFGSLAAQRPAYTTPTTNWGSANRDRDSRPSGGLGSLSRTTAGISSRGASDRFGSSSDTFGSSTLDRFGGGGGGGGSNDRFGSSSDRYGAGGGGPSSRFGGSGANDRFGGSGANDRFGGSGANDRFGGSGGSISVDRYGGGGSSGVDSGRFGGGNNDDSRFGGNRNSWSGGGGASSGGRSSFGGSGEPRTSWGSGYNSSSSYYK